ncbi:hypothetical protein [Reyranella sp.]|uniref:hypothetical protein n=1 Tax=Reyranella sp. TaxID=1929291 RepID=UPI0037850C44
MDWFERLTGFREAGYDETRSRLAVEGGELHCRVNGCRYGIGVLELASLADLRRRCASLPARGRLTVRLVTGDVRRLHRDPEYAGALFQVASQFNMLEMVSPDVTPEHGVTGYQHDRTQGPACAIAAGAATIYRNYFVPVEGRPGQTADRQLDGLADLGASLGRWLGLPPDRLWSMRNGYALCRRDGLAAITAFLQDASPEALDGLRSSLRIGVHRDVEVTDEEIGRRRYVSQAFCSALPVAYSSLPAAEWQSFAQLVLDAAYEATLCAAALNAGRGASNIVLLTSLGGGAFGNDGSWIDSAMRRSLTSMKDQPLDVRIVSYGPPSPAMRALQRDFA